MVRKAKNVWKRKQFQCPHCGTMHYRDSAIGKAHWNKEYYWNTI